MELKIEVDEIKFKEVIQEELNAFTKEELHSIIEKGIIQCLSNDVIKELLLEKQWNYRHDDFTYTYSQCLKEIINNCASHDLFDDTKKKIKEVFETDESVKEIGKSLFKELMISAVRHQLLYDNELSAMLVNRVTQAIQNR